MWHHRARGDEYARIYKQVYCELAPDYSCPPRALHRRLNNLNFILKEMQQDTAAVYNGWRVRRLITCLETNRPLLEHLADVQFDVNAHLRYLGHSLQQRPELYLQDHREFQLYVRAAKRGRELCREHLYDPEPLFPKQRLHLAVILKFALTITTSETACEDSSVTGI